MERVFELLVEPHSHRHADRDIFWGDIGHVRGDDRPFFKLDVAEDVGNLRREVGVDRLADDGELGRKAVSPI